MSLPLIKVLLLAAILLLGLFAFRGSRRAMHKVLWRGYGVLVATAAGLSVLFPDSLTRVAKTVGVGRGADLLLYTLIVTFMLVSLVLFRRLSELERRYIQLARMVALQGARRSEAVDREAGEEK